jgi:hypothetical protein
MPQAGDSECRSYGQYSTNRSERIARRARADARLCQRFPPEVALDCFTQYSLDCSFNPPVGSHGKTDVDWRLMTPLPDHVSVLLRSSSLTAAMALCY